jgi:hypothetical protein
MASHLDAFTIRVHRRKHPPNLLGDFDGSRGDMLTFLNRFLSSLNVTTSHTPNFTGIMTVDGHRIDKASRTVNAYLVTGHYGKVSRFIDINTNATAFARKRHHAEAFAFYLKAFIPENEDEGIILIQRIGTASAFRPFHYFFMNYFRTNYPGFVLKLQSLVNEEELKKLLARSTTRRIQISGFHLYKRPEDIQEHGYHEEGIRANLVIRETAKKERGPANRLKELVLNLSGDKRSTGIEELDEHIGSDSKIRVSLEEDGANHLIDLDSPKLRVSIEVDEPPETKIPAYRVYLENVAHDFMGEVAAQIWGENSDVWNP